MSQQQSAPPSFAHARRLPRPAGGVVPVEGYQRALDWLAQLGHAPETVLARAGVQPEELARPGGLLTLDQVEAFVLGAAELVNAPARALELGGRYLFPAFGDVGFAALTAPTVADAFVVFGRYTEVVSPLFVLEHARPEGALHVQVAPLYRLDDRVLLIHIQLLFGTLHALAHNALGAVPAGVEVALPVEDAALSEWLREHDVTVRPSVDTLSLWLPQHLADSSFALADATAHAAFVARCDERLRSRQTEHPMTRDVRAALAGPGPDFGDIDTVSALLQLSPRTIHRRLEREGTTFQQLHSAVRFAWAARELTHTNRPVTAIAADLGYANSANFTRAFGRIFGVTPTEHRQRAPLRPT